ncbi:MAG TPA: hypothetical protein PLV75_07460, partial [Saprospiraceae bacterium]|nr:hypothetical protein [Saprospiraceae bacterium]
DLFQEIIKTHGSGSRSRNKNETRKSEKANREARGKQKYLSEFLERRGFWFFFPEKKNTNSPPSPREDK